MKLKDIIKKELLKESFLIEKFVNAFSKNDMYKYADEVWNILELSYKGIGGYLGAKNIDHLIDKSYMWKMVRRNGIITAVKIYKQSFGRKSIAGGTNGTEQGKLDLFMIAKEDDKMARAWGEVSGAVAHLGKKWGHNQVPSKYAKKLLPDKNIEIIDDYKYSRNIGGKNHTKEIFGYPDIDFNE